MAPGEVQGMNVLGSGKTSSRSKFSKGNYPLSGLFTTSCIPLDNCFPTNKTFPACFLKTALISSLCEKKSQTTSNSSAAEVKKRTFIPSFIYLFLIFLILTAYVFRDVSN